MTSGPNQHFIPAFVQRPFGIPPNRRDIWYFERNKQPEKRAIKRAGSEDHFYSEPASTTVSTLDDEITKVEGSLSKILSSIRSIPMDGSVDPHDAASIVAHLALRTAHFRDSLKHGLSQLFDQAKVIFADADNLQAIAGLDHPAPNDRFREHVLSDLLERPGISELNLPTHVIERVAFYFAKENASTFLENSLPFLQPFLDGLLTGVGALVRDSHNKALAGTLKSNPRENFLQTLNWTIHSKQDPEAILPDCVVIAITNTDEAAPLMLLGQDDVRAIFLPVSPKKLLVGVIGGYKIPPQFNYCLEAARSSHSFFLSSYSGAETARLHPEIAARSTSILDEAVENGFQDLWPRRYSQHPEHDAEGPAPSYGPSDPVTREFQYELSFVSCGDQEAIQSITHNLRHAVSALSAALPLKRLDGITIAGDYPAALRDLDRGFENAPPVETVSNEVGVGIAQVVTVMRSGQVKGRIVIDSGIAHALTSDNSAQSEFGLYVVIRELALVAMIDFIETSLPGAMLSPVEGKLDGWLYVHVDAALHAYVASRISAGFGDVQELFEAKSQLLAEGVNRMRDTVLQERLAYRYHGDLDKLLDITLPSIRHVLIFAADLLGHCANACSPSPQTSDELQVSLEQAGLKNWLEMYRVDLEQFHRRLCRWESFNEFLALNVHVERLLWQLGMLPWEAPGGIRIEVPVGTDTAALLSSSENNIE